MKIAKVIRLEEKYTQYDISTAFENFYAKTNTGYILIHNSPAIFCGINPDNGKFFVGTKGVFNANAKLNYTDDDIDKNHSG